MRILLKPKLVSSIVVTTMLLVGCSDTKTPAEYIQLAEQSRQAGQPKQTIIYLKNLLKVDPKHVEGRIKLGQAYLSEGAWLNAIKELLKAIELGGNNEQAYTDLAKAYYYTFDVTGLEELSNLALSANNQEIIDFYYATVQIRENFVEEGLSLLRVILAQDSQSKYASLSRIWTIAFNQEFSVAQEQLQSLLSKEPDFYDAIEFSGYLALKLNNTSLAATQLEKFLKHYPDAHRVRLVYANALALNEDYINAEQQADFLLKIYRDNPLLIRIKAQIAFIKEDYNDAKSYAEKSLNTNSNLPIARIIAGVSAYKLGSSELAYSHLKVIAPYLTFQHPAKRILSALQLELGNYDDLYSELEEANTAELDEALLTFTSKELFNVGEKAKAESLLNLDNNPENEDKFLFQKGIYKLFDNDGSAVEYFEKILNKDIENESVSTLLALEFIRQEKYNEALDVIKHIKTYNESLALTLTGSVYKAQGDYENAKSSFKAAIKLDDKNSAAMLYSGQFAEIEKNYSLAFDFYKQVIQLKNEHLKAHEGLLRIAKHRSTNDLVIKFLQAHTEKNPNDISTITLSEILVKENKINDALKLTESELAKESDNMRLLDYKVKLFLLNKDYENALLTSEKLFSLQPKTSKYYTTRADIVDLSGEAEKSLSILKQGLQAYPQNLEILSKISNYYLDRGEVKLAEPYVDALGRVYPTNVATFRFKGKMAFIKKDYKQAISLLTKVNNQQNSLPVILELVQSYQETDEINKALELIENVEKVTAQTLPLKLLLKQAELYTDINSTKSLKIYHHLLGKTNEHFAILNNVAWLHFKNGDLVLAEEYARKALQKSKQSPAIMNTLGRVLNANSELVEAETLLKSAYMNSNANANYGVYYAQVLDKLDKKSEFNQVMAGLDVSSMNAESKVLFDTLSSN